MSYKFLEKFEKIFNKMKKSSKKEIDSTLDEAKNHMKSWEDILEKYKSTQEKKKTTNYQQLNYNIDVEPVEIIRRGYFEVGSINENRLIGGQFDQNFSVVATTFLIRKSSIQIERVRSI